jgi:hypothetical protein
VCNRIRELGIELRSFEEVVSLDEPRPVKAFVTYVNAVVHDSGLVYLSGQGGGTQPMNDESETAIEAGRLGAQKTADDLIRHLHWTFSCGVESDLNDVLYTVSALTLIASPGGGAFTKAPKVPTTLSYRWQSAFRGTFSDYAVTGIHHGDFSGLHTTLAMGGADNGDSIGADMTGWS